MIRVTTMPGTLFGRAKEPLLRQFLRLRHGIPSHDTFSRVFRLLDPAQFGACLIEFMRHFAQVSPGVVALDGKTLRRSFDRAAVKSTLHLVSAWAVDLRLVLGQLAVDDKSNEITALPKLLDMLTLKGAIVTADALNCQRRSPKRWSPRAAITCWRSGATKACCRPMSAVPRRPVTHRQIEPYHCRWRSWPD
jgi:DDE_Tnp_1-associated